jgi:hypothetical protein
MSMLLTELAARSLLAFFLVLAVTQLLCKEFGYFIGQHKARQPNLKDESVGIVSGSIFGLLAFALAFNLSMASTRYGERREAVLDEANSIGTLWLQAKAVSHPRGEAIAALTEKYITLRKEGVTAHWGDPAIETAAAEISNLQNEMWGHMIALAHERVDPQVTQLEGSMNATFDSTTTTQFAISRAAPYEVTWLLLGLSLVAMGVMGYQFGLNGHPHRALGATTVVVWTSVLMVILDLGSARIGDIRVDTSVYDSTLSSMKPIPIPPLAP